MSQGTRRGKTRQQTIGTAPEDVRAMMRTQLARARRLLDTHADEINDRGVWLLKRAAFAYWLDAERPPDFLRRCPNAQQCRGCGG